MIPPPKTPATPMAKTIPGKARKTSETLITKALVFLPCKGKEKAAGELRFSFLAYNMKRAINMVGVRKLIEVI